MKKIISIVIIVAVISSAVAIALLNRAPKVEPPPPPERVELNLGEMISEFAGNTNELALNFKSAEEMISNMQLACQNEKFELYYSIDNMTVALKNKQSGKIFTTNPYNAAADTNYSGNVANRLDSQVIITYLEEEKSLVNMYSSTDCSKFGQYTIKTYENGLVIDMSIGEEKEDNNVSMVFSKKRYEEIYNSVDEFDKELLDIYYVFYKKADLKDSGIYDLYPDMKADEDLYFCNFEISDREIRKLSALFERAEYTDEDRLADAKELKLGESTDSSPNFKLSLNYCLTENGVKVAIPNDSISFNEDFPLLKVAVLPYFGADEAKSDASGYLFIPDGSGAVINMNQNEPNRRTIITGKVYGENASELPKEEATETTEQYYLPVFGTVRNNNTAVFGVITNGDASSEITALLGRPNGNFYTTYPEFTLADHEKYTRVSVVENPWSNKLIYLYDKNLCDEDLAVEYYLLEDEKANYSSMAAAYRDYLFKDSKADANKTVLNLETLGSVLSKKTFVGFEYDSEAVLTSFEDDIKILKYLKEKKADNVSLQLKGWQKNGLDAALSNKLRISSALGGKSDLNKLIDYCKDEKINLSLYNNISFVKFDKAFDDFKTKNDAARTLELKYAEYASLSPDTMLYDNGSRVVKASSYNRYLTSLTESAKKYSVNLNLGELGKSLNADYSKSNGINRAQALRYIKQTLENNSKTDLSFEGANAYVLPFAEIISGVTNENTGFVGETASVPFLQMVMGDNVAYNSQPINLKENTRYELLKCIESGTIPTFLISYDNTAELKGTTHTSYFSVDYEILKGEMVDSYEYLEKVFTATEGSSVVEHKVLANAVAVSTYKNGAKIYVNMSEKEFSADGVTIPAMDYVIKE